MSEFGLTDQGFIAPRAADLLQQIRDEYEAETGLSIDWDVDVFLGVITGVLSDRGGDLAEMLQAIADSRDPDNATGHQLDTIAALVGVSRIPAAFSRVDLTLNGDEGTTIPQGSEVEYTDGVIWITQDSVTIGADGTATVEAQPGEVGAISAAASSDWEIVTPVDGWDTVETLADATPGRERETDAELRLRRAQSLQITGAAALNAIRSNVLEVEGVQAAIVVDNDQKSTQTVAGLSLPASSLAVVVYPDSLTSAQTEDLARTIYDRAPAGIELVGDESATVTGFDGFDKTIRWYFAGEVSVDVAITITGADPEDVEAEIEEAVEDYFASRGVGDPIRVLAILGLLSEIEGVESATVQLNGGAADIEPEITEIAILNSVTVS